MLNRALKLWMLVIGRLFPSFPHITIDAQSSVFYPCVSVHLAVSNEDPCVVLETLNYLSQTDYPNYHVIVVDNNTTTEKLWKPLEAFCATRPKQFTFYHVERLPGYKAGALNYALARTSPTTEIIAIVDADTIVEPEFLRAMTPHFADNEVAVVQSPLGFRRDPREHCFTAWIYLIYRYFLSIYMPAAARFGRAPFIGAMGLIRRKALEECGGWNGFYLTEDMEISGRLFNCGYVSLFVDHFYGRSMPPTDLKNFKRQHYRWNFGNAQIFRDNLQKTLRLKKKSLSELIEALAYLTCPGIYLNLYLLPFSLVAATFQIAAMVKSPIPGETFCCVIMLGVLATEIVGESLMFLTLGAYEGAPWLDRLRNLTAWWALSLTNARSTWAVLFRRTRPFEITGKGRRKEVSTLGQKSSELTFVLTTLGFGCLPSITHITEWSMASLVLGVSGALVSTTLVLPTEKRNEL